MADCKACGHRDTQHSNFGCNQGFCKCELSNQDVIDFEKLATLREAGEKMERMLEYVNNMNKEKELDNDESWLWSQNSDTGKKILTALAEWEAANK